MLDKILEKQGAFHGAEKTGKQGALGKDAFLKLLVTQLQHQDPLNPLDDKEFIAQLAQFSSLEQMNNISEGITSLVKKTQEQDMLNSVNYIGKEVTASGHSVTKSPLVVSWATRKIATVSASTEMTLMASMTSRCLYPASSISTLYRRQDIGQ